MELEPEHAMATLGEVLLTPTRIYARSILDLRAALVDAGHDLHGVGHVTGGGLPGNVPRVLPDELGAALDPTRWPMPSVMRLVGALGGLDDDQVRATFNGGIGMVVVLAPDAVATALTHLESVGVATYDIGEVVPRGELDGERYAEGSLR